MANWKPAKTAPRDGSVFIARFKNAPIPTLAAWSESEESWVAALHEIGVFQGMADPFFATDHFKPDELECWSELGCS